VTKRFYTPQEVAELLGVSSTTVMSRIHDGALPAVRVSERIYRIPIPAFERFRLNRIAARLRCPTSQGEARAATRRTDRGRGRRACDRVILDIQGIDRYASGLAKAPLHEGPRAA